MQTQLSILADWVLSTEYSQYAHEKKNWLWSSSASGFPIACIYINDLAEGKSSDQRLGAGQKALGQDIFSPIIFTFFGLIGKKKNGLSQKKKKVVHEKSMDKEACVYSLHDKLETDVSHLFRVQCASGDRKQ